MPEFSYIRDMIFGSRGTVLMLKIKDLKMIRNNLAYLFEVEPSQWGLRGDPFLWREMKANINSKEVDRANDFEQLLNDLFLELTKSRPENTTTIFVERYSLGGMSSGQVSSDFWLKTAFPMLVERFEELYGNVKKGDQ